MSIQGAQIEFQAGALIFKQGDPGGDLYFIKEGEVEVFRQEQGLEVNLATLRAGEVLGIMTCMTREPRLASARARGAVRATIVMQAGIKTLISSTPPWVHTVIKDFILRIKQIDDLYTGAMSRLERQARDASLLELATFYAGGLAELGALLAPVAGGEKIVDIEAAQKRLARVLGVAEDELERIFQVFVESGLIKMDPKATARHAEASVLERLGSFAQFAREFSGSSDRRQIFESLGPKDCGALLYLCERARAKFGVVADEIKIELSEVPAEKFAAATTKAAVDKIVALGLACFEPIGGTKVALVPNKISHSLRCLGAIHKLRALVSVAPVEKPAVQMLTENY